MDSKLYLRNLRDDALVIVTGMVLVQHTDTKGSALVFKTRLNVDSLVLTGREPFTASERGSPACSTASQFHHPIRRQLAFLVKL